MWQSTVTLKITGTNKPNGQFLVNYGVTDALAPFLLHSLVTQMTATINNNTVSMNVQETLPALLRMMDPDELAKHDCMTPIGLDFLGDYRDGVDLQSFSIDFTYNANSTTAGRLAAYTVIDTVDGQETHATDLPETGSTRASFAGARAQTFVSVSYTHLTLPTKA